MAQWTLTIDPVLLRADSTCELRVSAGGGKYVTLTVKDGETITTSDPATIKAIESLGAKVVTTLAQKPAKVTYDVDTKPKEDLPVIKAESTGTK